MSPGPQQAQLPTWTNIQWPSRGVARNNYLGGPGCNRDMLNIIPKSIEYKIINFHISSYSCPLMNIKNCLIQCRYTKKNIHIKSCLAMIFHEIKFIHYHPQWNSLQFSSLYKLSYYHIPCNSLQFAHYLVPNSKVRTF